MGNVAGFFIVWSWFLNVGTRRSMSCSYVLGVGLDS